MAAQFLGSWPTWRAETLARYKALQGAHADRKRFGNGAFYEK